MDTLKHSYDYHIISFYNLVKMNLGFHIDSKVKHLKHKKNLSDGSQNNYLISIKISQIYM
jgi:hypothetical protein